MTLRASPTVAWAEVLAVVALVQGYIWLFRGRGPAVVVIVAAVLLSHWWRGETPRSLGLSRRGFRASARIVIPAAITVAALIAGGAIARHLAQGISARDLLAVLAIFAGYTVWALVQQWALDAYFLNRFLLATAWWRHGRVIAVVLAAVVFGTAHLPAVWLAVPSTLLGLAGAAIYLRFRNLPALALGHAIIGTALVIALATGRHRAF